MTVRELAELVRAMREAQRTYFKTRTPESLKASMTLERELDAATAEILRPSLFTKEQR